MRLALVAAAVGVVLACAGPFIADWRGDDADFGLTSGTVLPTLGAPIVIAVVAFWHVGRQGLLDRRHGIGDG